MPQQAMPAGGHYGFTLSVQFSLLMSVSCQHWLTRLASCASQHALHVGKSISVQGSPFRAKME